MGPFFPRINPYFLALKRFLLVRPGRTRPVTSGFTLYEIVIYLALFLMLSILIVGLVIQLLTGGLKNSRVREVVAAITVALENITQETMYARGIYAPTSVFGSNVSQLSLETGLNPPNGDMTTFADFYLDNGRLFIKREGREASAITNNRVVVDYFRVTRIHPVLNSESPRIALKAHHRFSRAGEDDSFAATTTVTLRRY